MREVSCEQKHIIGAYEYFAGVIYNLPIILYTLLLEDMVHIPVFSNFYH